MFGHVNPNIAPFINEILENEEIYKKKIIELKNLGHDLFMNKIEKACFLRILCLKNKF